MPAVFHRLARGSGAGVELKLDTEIAVVLFLTYCASLIFTLRTHRNLYGLTGEQHAATSRPTAAEAKRAVIDAPRRDRGGGGGERAAGRRRSRPPPATSA